MKHVSNARFQDRPREIGLAISIFLRCHQMHSLLHCLRRRTYTSSCTLFAPLRVIIPSTSFPFSSSTTFGGLKRALKYCAEARRLGFCKTFMTFRALSPERRPLSGSDSTSASQEYLPQSRETGDVTPPGTSTNGGSVIKEAPVAKPWAHFVAGGCG